MSKHSDLLIDAHNAEEHPYVPTGFAIYNAIEPAALSTIVRGLVDRLAGLERTVHELQCRISELEGPEHD